MGYDFPAWTVWTVRFASFSLPGLVCEIWPGKWPVLSHSSPSLGRWPDSSGYPAGSAACVLQAWKGQGLAPPLVRRKVMQPLGVIVDSPKRASRSQSCQHPCKKRCPEIHVNGRFCLRQMTNPILFDDFTYLRKWSLKCLNRWLHLLEDTSGKQKAKSLKRIKCQKSGWYPMVPLRASRYVTECWIQWGGLSHWGLLDKHHQL